MTMASYPLFFHAALHPPLGIMSNNVWCVMQTFCEQHHCMQSLFRWRISSMQTNPIQMILVQLQWLYKKLMARYMWKFNLLNIWSHNQHVHKLNMNLMCLSNFLTTGSRQGTHTWPCKHKILPWNTSRSSFMCLIYQKQVTYQNFHLCSRMCSTSTTTCLSS
jgi:hypothetical protein